MDIEKTNEALRKVEVECLTADKVLDSSDNRSVVAGTQSARTARSAKIHSVTRIACTIYVACICLSQLRSVLKFFGQGVKYPNTSNVRVALPTPVRAQIVATTTFCISLHGFFDIWVIPQPFCNIRKIGGSVLYSCRYV
jgi:hypothetical protein